MGGNLGVVPEQLAGDGSWLTPRMYETASRSVEYADIFCADIVAAAWQKGDPVRCKARLNSGPRKSVAAPSREETPLKASSSSSRHSKKKAVASEEEKNPR